METPTQFLGDTEKAMVALFRSIQELRKVEADAPTPVMFCDCSEESFAEKYLAWQKVNSEAISKSWSADKAWWSNFPSMSVLAGSILTIAYSGIEFFSPGPDKTITLPGSFKDHPKRKKFCRGRIISGVPLGFIIYAGRHQFVHRYSNEPHDPTKEVFEHLVTHYLDGVRHPALDLSNDILSNYALNYLDVIGWENCSAYLDDMKDMIGI